MTQGGGRGAWGTGGDDPLGSMSVRMGSAPPVPSSGRDEGSKGAQGMLRFEPVCDQLYRADFCSPCRSPATLLPSLPQHTSTFSPCPAHLLPSCEPQ